MRYRFNNDDEVLGCCLYTYQYLSTNVVLLTEDKALSIKARANGIHAKNLSQVKVLSLSSALSPSLSQQVPVSITTRSCPSLAQVVPASNVLTFQKQIESVLPAGRDTPINPTPASSKTTEVKNVTENNRFPPGSRFNRDERKGEGKSEGESEGDKDIKEVLLLRYWAYGEQYLTPKDLLVCSQLSLSWNKFIKQNFRDFMASYFHDATGVLVRSQFTYGEVVRWYREWRRQVLPIQQL